MKKNIMILIICIFAALTLMACGETNGACTSESECAGSEQCIWRRDGDRVIGKMCSIRCAEDVECPPGTTCSGGASSCPTCNDYIQVCK